MNKGIRKLVLSSIMCATTALTAVSSTFAFVSLQTEAKVSEFSFNIENQEGLLISLDGTHFSQDLSYTQITGQILDNAFGAAARENGALVKTMNDLALTGVTLNADNTGKIDMSEQRLNAAGVSEFYPKFVKDSLKLGTDPAGLNNIWYDHEMIDTQAGDYIQFDVWFKMATNGTETGKYELKFAHLDTDNDPTTLERKTQITSSKSTVSLDNNLTTMTDTYGPKVAGKETIDVYAADAMRMAVSVLKADSSHDVYVFEPNDGLGSSSIEGATDAKHDKTKNAMYTYYNATHPISPFIAAATDCDGFNTIEDVTSQTLGTFEVDATSKEYNIIKMNIMLYLEGWDADYFMGMTANDIQVQLNFKLDKIA